MTTGKKDATSLTAKDAFSFYSHSLGGMSETTAYLYSRDIAGFVNWVGQDTPLIELTPGDLREWIASENPGFSVSRRRYYALRSFYRTIGLHGFVESLQVPDQAMFETQPIPYSDGAKILGAKTTGYLTNDHEIGIRELAISHLAYSLLSPTDVVGMTVSDFDYHFGVIFYDGKMSPVSTVTKDVLARWLVKRRQKGRDTHFITSADGLGIELETVRLYLARFTEKLVGTPYSFRNFHASRYRDDINTIGDTARLARLWGLSPTTVEIIKQNIGEI